MDAIDALILSEIVWKPADPRHRARGPRRPSTVARALGIHTSTVKRRIADMRDRGFLRGVHLMPAGAVVGQRVTYHALAFPDVAAKREGIRRLAAEPAVWKLYSLVASELLVQTATPRDEEATTAVGEMAADAGATSTRFHHAYEWDVPTERVTPTDLRILAAFADDALRPITEAAAIAGVSTKTASTRLRALASIGAYSILPDAVYATGDGTAVHLIDMTLDEAHGDDAHAALPTRFPNALCRSIRNPANAYVVVSATHAVDLEEDVARAESMRGVRSARIRMVRDTLAMPERYRDALLARAAELVAARRASSAAAAGVAAAQ